MPTDRLSGLNMGVSFKIACTVATTGNITLYGTQTIDGITVGNYTSSGERVLVNSQTNPLYNGIYSAQNSTWIRSRDCDGNRDIVPGSLVYVDRGTNHGRSFWVFNSSSTSPSVTVGTDNITVAKTNVSITGVNAWVETNWFPITSALSAKSLLTIDPTVKDYGAAGDGITDDTSSIQAAFNAGVGKFPAGTYRVSSGMSVSSNGLKIRGEGTTKTKIVHYGTTSAVFVIGTGLTNIEVSHMTISRSTTVLPSSGGIGLDFSLVGSHQLIEELHVDHHYDGIRLGPTDFSWLKNSLILQNRNVGVFIQNSTSDGSCQWSIENVLSANNGAHGFSFMSQAGPAQCTAGTWINLATYANTGRGVNIIGSSNVPIHGIRILGGFFGQDGDHEVILDTFGTFHKIQDAFMELAGTIDTGPNSSSTASGTGDGVSIFRNRRVLLENCYITQNSQFGVYTNSSATLIIGCFITGNGLNGIYRDTSALEFVAVNNYFAENASTVPVINDAVGQGVGSLIAHNIGYITENSGSAIVSSGNTTVQFDHGLSESPLEVFITRGNAGDSSANAFILAVSTTSITISNGVTAGANRTFYWTANTRRRGN